MTLAELSRCTGQERCTCEPWTGGGKQGADFHFHKRGWPQAEPPMKMLQPQPAQHRLSGNSSEGAVMTKGGLGQGSAVDWAGAGGTARAALLMESRLGTPPPHFLRLTHMCQT